MEWNDQQQEKALRELESWRGLRHIDRRAEPGRGIDCIHLVFQAWYAAGFMEPKRLPNYSIRWGFMSPENLMASALEILVHSARLPNAVPQFGDAVIWKAGAQSNHCGIVAPSEAGGPLKVWHVMKGGQVHATPLDPVVCRCQELVRLTGYGWKTDPSTVELADLERSEA